MSKGVLGSVKDQLVVNAQQAEGSWKQVVKQPYSRTNKEHLEEASQKAGFRVPKERF